ncbi:MAG TPA: hypothetical protein VF707_08260 [Ardenticatenaceae bacterium]|jgi:hypothetical protein
MTDQQQTGVPLVITTSSRMIQYSPNMGGAQLPSITLGGQALTPSQTTTWPTGYQMVLLDVEGIVGPEDVRLNKYYLLPSDPNGGNSWWQTYVWVYQQMLHDILVSGNTDNYLLILASFGLDNNMAPTDAFLNMLFGAGAGKTTQYWLTHCDIGSQAGNATSWVSQPANYIFVGYAPSYFGMARGELHETGDYNTPVNSTLSITL